MIHIDTYFIRWHEQKAEWVQRIDEGTPEFDHRIKHCGPPAGCYHSYSYHSPSHEDGECEEYAKDSGGWTFIRQLGG